MTPVGVIRPIAGGFPESNQMFPSGPAVMSPVSPGNVFTAPVGVIRPLSMVLVNQTLPSGPAVTGPILPVIPIPNFVTENFGATTAPADARNQLASSSMLSPTQKPKGFNIWFFPFVARVVGLRRRGLAPASTRLGLSMAS